LGITLEIPKNFQPISEELFGELELIVIEIEPFTRTIQHAFVESSGKGILIISELEFIEGVSPERHPLDYINIYTRNLAIHYGVDEITGEEIHTNDINTVVLAMIFGDDDYSLFKGLSYVFPNRFFMIDLYIYNATITRDDAIGFQNIFNSIRRL